MRVGLPGLQLSVDSAGQDGGGGRVRRGPEDAVHGFVGVEGGVLGAHDGGEVRRGRFAESEAHFLEVELGSSWMVFGFWVLGAWGRG